MEDPCLSGKAFAKLGYELTLAGDIPVYSSIAEYLKCTGKLNLDIQAVTYGEDGTIKLQFEEV